MSQAEFSTCPHGRTEVAGEEAPTRRGAVLGTSQGWTRTDPLSSPCGIPRSDAGASAGGQVSVCARAPRYSDGLLTLSADEKISA